jgi:hypothetical protein
MTWYESDAYNAADKSIECWAAGKPYNANTVLKNIQTDLTPLRKCFGRYKGLNYEHNYNLSPVTMDSTVAQLRQRLYEIYLKDMDDADAW